CARNGNYYGSYYFDYW
nr:immunoglobulin heavy chain junction region [Mus musculus]